jgi:hypothetical protein
MLPFEALLTTPVKFQSETRVSAPPSFVLVADSTVLTGKSVHKKKMFIARGWEAFIEPFHQRSVCVAEAGATASNILVLLKALVLRFTPNNEPNEFRGTVCIQYSMNECKHIIRFLQGQKESSKQKELRSKYQKDIMLLTEYFAKFRRGFWIGMGSETAWNVPGFDVARDDFTQVMLRSGHPIFNPYRQYEDWPKDPTESPRTYHFMYTPVIQNRLGLLIQDCCRHYEVWENIRQMRQRLLL